MKRENSGLLETPVMFKEEICLQILRHVRWNGTITCLRCGSALLNVLKNGNRSSVTKYACIKCKYQFSDITGSIFHKTRTSLSKWFYAIYLVAEMGGITIHGLKNQLRVTYKTAWRMLNVIHNAPLAGRLHREMKSTFFHHGQHKQQPMRPAAGKQVVLP